MHIPFVSRVYRHDVENWKKLEKIGENWRKFEKI